MCKIIFDGDVTDPFRRHYNGMAWDAQYRILICLRKTMVLSWSFGPGILDADSIRRLPEAARNPAILHGIMYSSSTHLEALHGKEASSVALRKKNRREHLEQKGEAIRAIREGFKDESHQDSDALIQSIIALAMCEVEEHDEVADVSYSHVIDFLISCADT